MKIFHNLNITTTQDSPEARHMRWHIEHKGHESMHAEMILIMIAILVLGQFILFYWKRVNFRSYQFTTTIGMWIIPFCMSIYNHYYRFMIVHTIYSAITLYMIYKSTLKPMSLTTPRTVYTWFYAIFKLSYALGAIGYIGLLSVLFGLNVLLMLPVSIAYHFVMAFFYGLYFGTLNRDISEICADKIASSKMEVLSGGKVKDEAGEERRYLDKNSCFICGDKIFTPILIPDDKVAIEKSFRLECGHVFHEFCIRGWCMVGKKQTCPYCKEKVDLKTLFPNPWERLHVMYGRLLDLVRYLIAWQPLITLLIEGINQALDLK